MQIVYDLAVELEYEETGDFAGTEALFAIGNKTAMQLVQIEDTRSIFVNCRTTIESGMGIRLAQIPGLATGDRLTVTGRVSSVGVLGNSWSVALSIYSDEHARVSQHVAPTGVFALTHVLDTDDATRMFSVHTCTWGPGIPDMPLYIDAIRITRREAPEAPEAPESIQAPEAI